jgi:hypothetical protein
MTASQILREKTKYPSLLENNSRFDVRFSFPIFEIVTIFVISGP